MANRFKCITIGVPCPRGVPFNVEAGKKYKIEIRYAQLNNWQANIEFDLVKRWMLIIPSSLTN